MLKQTIKTGLAGLAAWAVSGMALAVSDGATGSAYNLPLGVTAISREVHNLHNTVLLVVTLIGIGVFGTMIWSIIHHRRSKHPKPADFHESTTVEIIWTLVPFLVLIGLAVPAAGTLIKMEDTRNAALTVKVTGFQWGWKYEYVGQNYEFVSMLDEASNQARQLGSGIDPKTVPHYLWNVTNPLVLPVGQKVRFLITGQDVIHAWWVNDLAIKKDAIPGYINEAWTNIEQPGTYRGVCAELCGRDHGFMPIVVNAVPEVEFKSWLAQKKGVTVAELDAPAATVTDAKPVAALPVAPAATPIAAAAPADKPAAAAPAKAMSKDDLMTQGKKVYEANCQACHQANGGGMPPNFPALAGSKVVNGDAKAHIVHALKGKGLMPPFASLSDADLASAVTYERNSWGNKASVVQPADVAAARQ
jgi:cytochrome c oxidase subunit II